MPYKLNTAEGQTSGTTLTAANSGGGSGDPFDQVVKSGAGAVTFSNEQAFLGTQSYKITSTTNSAVYLINTPTLSMSSASQAAFYFTGYPDVNQVLFSMRTSGGSAPVASLTILSTGAVRFTNSLNVTISISSAGLIPLNTWIRFDLCATIGTTTSNGRLQASINDGNSSTPLWSYDTGYTANAGTAAIGAFYAGKIDTTPVMATLYVDAFSINSTSTSLLQPHPVANSAWYTA